MTKFPPDAFMNTDPAHVFPSMKLSDHRPAG